MAYRDTLDCPKCGSIVFISEMPMGVPGGRVWEDIHCPKEGCFALVTQLKTDGRFIVSLTNKHLSEDESSR